MKNILSENMLRFGVKNLSESNKKRLTLESIMQTINEHGLVEEVKMALNENPLTVDGDGTKGLSTEFPVGTEYGSNGPGNFYIKSSDGTEYVFGVPFYMTAVYEVIKKMKTDGVVSADADNLRLSNIISLMYKDVTRA